MASTTRKSRPRRNGKVKLVRGTASEIIAAMGITRRDLKLAKAAVAAAKRRPAPTTPHATK